MPVVCLTRSSTGPSRQRPTLHLTGLPLARGHPAARGPRPAGALACAHGPMCAGRGARPAGCRPAVGRADAHEAASPHRPRLKPTTLTLICGNNRFTSLFLFLQEDCIARYKLLVELVQKKKQAKT